MTAQMRANVSRVAQAVRILSIKSVPISIETIKDVMEMAASLALGIWC